MGAKPGTPDSFSGSVMPPRTKAPSPSSTMTGRWISGGFGFLRGRGGAGECEETPLSPFTGLDLGVVVRSGGVWGGGVLGMWSAGIYISSLDIDRGSASACRHSLETLVCC